MWGCLSCPESSGDLSLWWQWGSTAVVHSGGGAQWWQWCTAAVVVVVHSGAQWWAPMSGDLVGSNPTLSVHSWPVGRPATSREILTRFAAPSWSSTTPPKVAWGLDHCHHIVKVFWQKKICVLIDWYFAQSVSGISNLYTEHLWRRGLGYNDS